MESFSTFRESGGRMPGSIPGSPGGTIRPMKSIQFESSAKKSKRGIPMVNGEEEKKELFPDDHVGSSSSSNDATASLKVSGKSELRKKLEVTRLRFNTEADLDRFYGRSATFDFEAAAAEHGYLKARQMLQQFTLDKEQKIVERVNTSGPAFDTRSHMIMLDRTKLSRTVGLVNTESTIDKIVALAKDNRSEQINREGHGAMVAKTADQIIREKQNSDLALHRAMISDDGVLFFAQAGLDCLPLGLGDTLCLQTSFLRSLNCHGNKLPYFTSHMMPQLNMNHFRYIKEINLSNNKIKTLPQDFGTLSMLRVVKLAGNILGALPASIAKLKGLKEMDLSNNTFSTLPVEVGQLESLQQLNLSNNAFATVPSCLTKLGRLMDLNMNKNYILHLGILPMVLLKPKDLWRRSFDESDPRNPHFIYVNVLTREVVVHTESYDGKGIRNDPELHVFQPFGTPAYNRRKLWLSICQVQEWEAVVDPATTLLYYQNNISGEVQWEMPDSMDLIGAMKSLQNLELSYNGLKIIPESMSQMTQLKNLTIQFNHIHDLPKKIGNMSSLEVLDVQNNDIAVLPYSILRCSNLQKLNLMNNALVKLPDLIGTMEKLTDIDVACNRLTTLPFSLGFSKILKKLALHENPLVDPPTSECDKGLPQVQWYMRNRMHIVNRGMPPVMKYHQTGLQDEVTMLLPELKDHVNLMIEKGEKSGFLNLQLMNLKYIPQEVTYMKNLKRLRLDCNWALSLRLGIPPEMGRLQVLSFKSCKLPMLPDSISNLCNIHHLVLQDNCLEYLPPSFTSLTTLVHLDLSKNRLYDLPHDLGNLVALEMLDLEDNFLEFLPSNIRSLQELKYLNAARNRIIDIPLELCLLKNLRKLNLERNKLIRLPELMGFMNKLTDVRVGYNRLEMLAEDLFGNPEGLIKSLKHFNCSENNLPELPNSICMLDPELRLEADFNPLISPPPELLKGGLLQVQEYLRVRMVRQRELCDLVTELDFEYIMDRTHPVACDVLEDGLGFLSPFDTAGFDQACHEFLNGEYYNCPASGNEIATRLAKLREQREEETYLTILKTFFLVIGKCRMDKNQAYGPAVLMQVERPWGRNNENTDCWALSLQCLLRDNPPNKFQPKGRESVFSLLQKAMPEMPWPFTVELLKDALRLYTTPYGQIADTEPVKFALCDCIDEEGEPLGHFLPCEKPAVVLCMALYTEEEVLRQDAEETDLFDVFWELEMDICAWLMTPEGSRELALETTRRKSQVMTDIRVREQIQISEAVKLKEARKEQKEQMKKVDLYNDREPVYMHGIYSDEQRDQIIAEHVNIVNIHEARLAALSKSLDRLNAESQLAVTQQKRAAAEDLMQKYSKFVNDGALHPLRRYAAQFNVGRPWDGFSGAAFEEWKSRFGGGSGDDKPLDEDDDEDDASLAKRKKKKVITGKDQKLPSRTMELNSHEDALDASRLSCFEALQADRHNNALKRKTAKTGDEDSEDDDDDGAELVPEYTWDDTEMMSIWQNDNYDTFKRKTGDKRVIEDVQHKL